MWIIANWKLVMRLIVSVVVVIFVFSLFSFNTPCIKPIWLGSTPIVNPKAQSTVQNQSFFFETLLDDDPTYSLTVELPNQKSPLATWRYGWVACPFVIDLGGPPIEHGGYSNSNSLNTLSSSVHSPTEISSISPNISAWRASILRRLVSSKMARKVTTISMRLAAPSNSR